MAGHSKWANIKHRKAKEDKRRGKVFTKLIREITIATRLGSADQNTNPRLRAAVLDALANNMTKDTIERAIKRGSGEADEGGQIEEILYEGYGPGGIAVMVYTMTDNRNRTVSELRHAFTKCGGNLGTDGSVAYLFKKVGLIVVPPLVDSDRLLEVAMDVGADDISENEDNSIDVITPWEQVHDIRQALDTANFKVLSASVVMLPIVQIPTADIDTASSILKLIDMIEELDDVQNVYSNADISDEIMDKLVQEG
jgi:YebC/PmpR family DNA-binding regulatory protein